MKNKIADIEAWLQMEPLADEIFPSPYGGRHVPIELLRPLLDIVHADTSNFVFVRYRQGYDDAVAASIELSITYPVKVGRSKQMIVRKSSGACNFLLKQIFPILDWNATAKSLCIKNAASFLAPRFGRNLNQEVVPVLTEAEVKDQILAKVPADIRVLKMYEEALINGDETTIQNLINAYDMNIENAIKEK